MSSPESIRSVLKFLESQEHKYRELLATGDAAPESKRFQRPSEVVQKAYFEAKKLIDGGMPKMRALEQAEISRRSYEKYDKKYNV